MSFKEKVTEIALQAGGVHYPEVNRMQLEVYTKIVIDECISALSNTDRRHVCTTFDQGQLEATMANAATAIKERFGL